LNVLFISAPESAPWLQERTVPDPYRLLFELDKPLLNLKMFHRE
jgi:hypothetical protein